jgi:hypothetical protein
MKTFKLPLLWMAVPTLLLTAADSPFVGTWKIDVNKSKFAKGTPSYFDATVQIEAAGSNRLKSTGYGTDNEGLAGGLGFNCTLDGTPCPVVSSVPARSASTVDTITLKLVNERSLTAVGMNHGKPVYTDQRIISTDGRMMTITRKGSTADGKGYENTIVLMRTQ